MIKYNSEKNSYEDEAGKTLTPEEVTSAIANGEKAKNDLTGVVEELKTTRSAKQQIQDEKDKLELALKAKEQGITETPEETVKRLLSERDKSTAAANKQKAEDKFKNLNKEFHPDNDPGGIKFKAVMDKINSRFSTSNLTSEDEFLDVYKDAFKLIKDAPREQGKDYNPNAFTPNGGTPPPREVNAGGLSDKEKKLIESLGWSEDRYKKTKASNPDFVDSLLK